MAFDGGIRVAAALLLAVALSGCGGHGRGRDDARPLPQTMVYSPNGEPLTGGALGRRPCVEALDAWFDRLDGAHVGRIGHDLFLADAQTQFDRMDLDHDGFITAEELSRFRPQFEEARLAVSPREAFPGDAKDPEGRHRQDAAGGRTTPRATPMAADPVMSADTDLDFRVSRKEFLQQAETIFKTLDSDHLGAFARPAVERGCVEGRWHGW